MTRRLKAVLDMRKTYCAIGIKAHGGDCPVFGDRYGRPFKGVRTAWRHARRLAGLPDDLHLADLRHEAGSSMLEHDADVHELKEMLGHTNLETTTRYLNTSVERLKRTTARVEAAREAARQAAKQKQETPPQHDVAHDSDLCGITAESLTTPKQPEPTVQ